MSNNQRLSEERKAKLLERLADFAERVAVNEEATKAELEALPWLVEFLFSR